MLVGRIMSKRVVTTEENETLFHVLKKFVKYNISGVPVMRGKKLVGIVTESDIIGTIDAFSPKIHYDRATGFGVILAALKCGSCFEAAKKEMLGSRKLKVKAFMTRNPITIGPDETVEKAARLMLKHKVNRLPVLKNGRLVGIIARADLVKALEK
ncbi:MAG: CBS domain-containing protein [Candidatus Aenigmatarchaeota archaeon]